jgi:hypothetical protein
MMAVGHKIKANQSGAVPFEDTTIMEIQHKLVVLNSNIVSGFRQWQQSLRRELQCHTHQLHVTRHSG